MTTKEKGRRPNSKKRSTCVAAPDASKKRAQNLPDSFLHRDVGAEGYIEHSKHQTVSSFSHPSQELPVDSSSLIYAGHSDGKSSLQKLISMLTPPHSGTNGKNNVSVSRSSNVPPTLRFNNDYTWCGGEGTIKVLKHGSCSTPTLSDDSMDGGVKKTSSGDSLSYSEETKGVDACVPLNAESTIVSDVKQEACIDPLASNISCLEKLTFNSFNKPIPSESLLQSGSVVHLYPPGFAPYKTTDSSYDNDLRQIVDGFSRNPLPLVCLSRSNGVLSNTDEVGDTHCSLSRVLQLWYLNVIPYLQQEDELWCSLAPSNNLSVRPLQCSTFFQAITSYLDVYFAEQTFYNAAMIRALTMLHVVRHLLQVRESLLTHNRMLREYITSLTSINKRSEGRFTRSNAGRQCGAPSALPTTIQDGNPSEHHSLADDSTVDTESLFIYNNGLRDQGFTRPRVLLLASTRHIAKTLVDLMLRLFPRMKQIRNRKRFDKEYGCDLQEGDDVPYEELASHLVSEGKPPDYAEQFCGNNNDQFRFGIRLHSSGATLYAPFYNSDVIVASPLGLQLLIGGPTSPHREYDFLSSLEIVVIDRADILSMQNWSHVCEIFSVINAKPQKWQNDCDIRRLRHTFVNGQAKMLRQTIVLSYGRLPEALALFQHDTTPCCCNYRGFLKLFCSSTDAYLRQGDLRVSKQILMMLPCKSITDIHETRLEFFAQQFPPSFLAVKSVNDINCGRLLLVVPSYVEYLRVRKVLKTSKTVAGDARNLTCFRGCHEYSSNRMLSVSRHMFLTGKVNLLITTERFLFYRRYLLKGADHVVFYRPPYYPFLYTLCLDALNDASQAVALTLITPFDSLNVEKYLGSSRTASLFKVPPVTAKIFIIQS